MFDARTWKNRSSKRCVMREREKKRTYSNPARMMMNILQTFKKKNLENSTVPRSFEPTSVLQRLETRPNYIILYAASNSFALICFFADCSYDASITLVYSFTPIPHGACTMTYPRTNTRLCICDNMPACVWIGLYVTSVSVPRTLT